jgi:hypothetical protein
VQNVASVFDDTLERIREPVAGVMFDRATACFAYRNKASGACLVALWDDSATPGDAFETRPAQVFIKGLAIREPVWVDLVSGGIYEIPSDRILKAGAFTVFQDLPLYDAPVLIAEKALVVRNKE